MDRIKRNGWAGSVARWLVGMTFVLLTPLAFASAVCVSTSAQLVQELNNVRYAAETIMIAQGAYNIERSPWYDYDNYYMQPGTSLIGGYSYDCSSRTIAAGNTVLVENNGPGPASFELVGDLLFEGLTLSLVHGMNINADNDVYQIAPNPSLTIARSEITGSGGDFEIYWNEDADIGGSVQIVDSLIVGNNAQFCNLDFAESNGNLTITMTNNTVVNNTGGAVNLGGAVCINANENGAVLLAHDNIFFGNGGADLFSNIPNLELVDNVIGTHNYPTPSPAPIGTQTGNPQLDSFYRPIESPASPVINSGEIDNGQLPATDLDGGPRVVGNHVDRGAYESSLVDSFVINVTNTHDSGTGSLRSAILSANASNNASTLIGFQIAGGCGPHVISLTKNLPNITKSVFISGYSQAGASANDQSVGDDAVLCIILDGATNGLSDGLMVAANAPVNTQLLLHGLAFSGFSHGAISLYGGSVHSLSGNHIGGAVGGVSLAAVGTGIILGPGVGNSVIGGSDPADRNIVGSALADGIVIEGVSGTLGPAHDNQVVNNYIGVGWNTQTNDYFNRGNTTRGIHIAGENTLVSDNLIAYSGTDAIDLDSTTALGNSVSGNFIGSDGGGTPLGNTGMGVRLENNAHANNVIGNRIADNGGAGVRVVSGQGNAIRKNALFNNPAGGIDLAAAGVTPNDDDGAAQVAGYANRGQNFPVLSMADGQPSGGIVNGTLTTTPGTYTIDLYEIGTCDASGYGPGGLWLHAATVSVSSPTSGDQASVSFNIAFKTPATYTVPLGAFITATATDSLGNTSEFSACRSYIGDEIFANGFQ